MQNKLNLNPLLGSDEAQVIKASVGKKIESLTKPEIATHLSDLILKCQVDSKRTFKKEADELDSVFVKTLSTEFTEDLKSVKKFSLGLTLSDVSLAFYWGIRGKFTQYWGFDNASFYRFCDMYLESEVRKSAIQKQKKFEQVNQPDGSLTREQIDQLSYDNAIAKFEMYKRVGHFMDGGASTYEYLTGLKLLKFTEEEMGKFTDQAQAKLKKMQENRKFAGDTKYMIEAQIRLIEQRTSSLVLFETRREALTAYFESLVMLNMDFKTILDEQIKKNKQSQDLV